jgi:uncharacterized protein
MKLASRPDWKRVTKRKFSAWKLREATFTGYVTRIDLLEVTSPLWVQSCGERICVADTGYSWLQHFPHGTHYTLTSQWNDKGQIVQWYFDICDHHGVTDDGIPYWDDLYLDVIGLPNHTFEIIDADELRQALAHKEISRAKYNFASREADSLLRSLEIGDMGLLEIAQHHFHELN